MRKRKLSFYLLVILLLILSALLAFTPLGTIASYYFVPTMPENKDETIKVEGLNQQVKISYDSYGIPHIEAANLQDLAFAAGFVQARYRFFQMDVLRHFARGRVSELLGEQHVLGSTTVDFDIAMRGWGFAKRAIIKPGAFAKEDLAVYKAFTDGVNVALKKYRPIEHKILGIEAKPWTMSDSIISALLQAWSITHNWEQEAVRLALALNLGLERAEKIYPNEPLSGNTTIERHGPRRSLPPAIVDEIRDIFPQRPVKIGQALDKLRYNYALGDLAELRPSASNAWVVGKSRSKSGHAILANDMHLSHTLPSLLFLMHIKTPEVNAIGVTMPGLPFIVAGHNGKVVWGSTAAVADVVDLIIEKEDKEKPGFVINESKECKLEKETIVIKIKGAASKSFTLRRTCNGALLNDMYPHFLPENAPMVALRWHTVSAERSLVALLQANQSADVFSLRSALMKIPSPVTNVMAADSKGNIATFATGSVPIRRNHRGSFATAGFKAKYEWQGLMRISQMPHWFNPRRDYIANGNNLLENPYYRRPLFHIDSAPSYRMDRIIERLTEIEKHDAASMQSIQTDNLAIRARELTSAIINDLKGMNYSDEEAKAYQLLNQWNYVTTAESTATLIFYSIYRKAILLALEDEVSKDVLHTFTKQRYSTNVCDLWFKDANHVVWDDLRTENQTETRKEVIRQAFRLAMKELKKSQGRNMKNWQWGRMHYHQPKHMFGGKAILSFFNLDKTGIAGSLDTVWKAHFNLSNEGSPFKTVAGPAYRMVVDTADFSKAKFVIDTGESGWPLSKHYSDLYQKWRAGELVPMWYSEADLRANTEAVIVLEKD